MHGKEDRREGPPGERGRWSKGWEEMRKNWEQKYHSDAKGAKNQCPWLLKHLLQSVLPWNSPQITFPPSFFHPQIFTEVLIERYSSDSQMFLQKETLEFEHCYVSQTPKGTIIESNWAN